LFQKNLFSVLRQKPNFSLCLLKWTVFFKGKFTNIFGHSENQICELRMFGSWNCILCIMLDSNEANYLNLMVVILQMKKIIINAEVPWSKVSILVNKE